MDRKYEVVHNFKSETAKERSDNLYQILLDYKNHLSAVEKIKGQEGIEDDYGSPVHKTVKGR